MTELTILESGVVAHIRSQLQLPSTTARDLLPVVLEIEREARALGYVFRTALVMAELYPGQPWARVEVVIV